MYSSISCDLLDFLLSILVVAVLFVQYLSPKCTRLSNLSEGIISVFFRTCPAPDESDYKVCHSVFKRLTKAWKLKSVKMPLFGPLATVSPYGLYLATASLSQSFSWGAQKQSFFFLYSPLVHTMCVSLETDSILKLMPISKYVLRLMLYWAGDNFV